MAVTKYSIGVSTFINDLETALNAKGLITLTKYKDATNLIFTTPLTGKVIKINILNTTTSIVRAYYGDAWTSGTTITNSVTFSYASTGTDIDLAAADLYADTNFFALLAKTNDGTYGLTYVGALDNGDVLVFGLGTSIDGTCAAFNMTDAVDLYPITFSPLGFKDASANLFTMPLMWANAAGVLEWNTSVPSGTVGIKVSSIQSTGVNSIISGAAYTITPANMKLGAVRGIYSALLIEFTP